MALATSIDWDEGKLLNRRVSRRFVTATSDLGDTSINVRVQAGVVFLFESESKIEKWYALTESAIETAIDAASDPTTGKYSYEYGLQSEFEDGYDLERSYETEEELIEVTVTAESTIELQDSGEVFDDGEGGYYFKVKFISTLYNIAYNIDGSAPTATDYDYSAIDDIVVNIPITASSTVTIKHASLYLESENDVISPVTTDTFEWGVDVIYPS